MGRHGFEPRTATATAYPCVSVSHPSHAVTHGVCVHIMARDTTTETTISEAIELYIQDRQQELAPQTQQSHRYRLNHLIRFCDNEDIDSVSSITPMDLTRYKQWRQRDGDLNITSMHTQLTTLSVFIQWCESKGMLPNGTHESIQIPTLDGEDQRDRRLDAEVAQKILSYLSRFEYAQRSHVIMRLLWRTAMRLGALHSLDVDDYDSNAQRLKIVHRDDTPIKKASRGERHVSLNETTCEMMDDWIAHHRHAVTDENGRNPLITSEQGRLTKSSIRRHVYRLTQPCYYTGECPHDRDIPDCEAAGYGNSRGCPSSLPPHDIRRGSITHFLVQDIPKEIVQDRCDVSGDVIDDHYDTRSEEKKMEQRREYFE